MGLILNMELDLQSYLGSCVQLYSWAETPQLPPTSAFGLIYEGAIGQQDRRHLFVTPCHCMSFLNVCLFPSVLFSTFAPCLCLFCSVFVLCFISLCALWPRCLCVFYSIRFILKCMWPYTVFLPVLPAYYTVYMYEYVNLTACNSKRIYVVPLSCTYFFAMHRLSFLWFCLIFPAYITAYICPGSVYMSSAQQSFTYMSSAEFTCMIWNIFKLHLIEFHVIWHRLLRATPYLSSTDDELRLAELHLPEHCLFLNCLLGSSAD